AALPGKLKLAAAPIYGEGTVAKGACDLFHEQIAMRVFQYGSPLCKRGYLLNQARQGIGRAAHKADNRGSRKIVPQAMLIHQRFVLGQLYGLCSTHAAKRGMKSRLIRAVIGPVSLWHIRQMIIRIVEWPDTVAELSAK